MEILPRTLGTRPRLACEVRAEGVVAARAEDANAQLSAVSRVLLTDGAAVRAVLVAAVRKALEAVAMRTREVTLVVPDAAVRVLLLDFDALPGKAAEALSVVRFRLKKLLPFDADDAALSYQVMATAKGMVRVVAVAMPREVLADYEGVVREAGFEPGAVLPSTLAALAGLIEGEVPMLAVNAGRDGVTTAIVKGGLLLLHRSVDLRAEMRVEMRAKSGAGDLPPGNAGSRVAVVDRESSAEEWSRQQPLGNAIDAVAAMPTAVLEQEMVLERSLVAAGSEVAQAVSVAAAYFEDTLEIAPEVVRAAGTLGADALAALLDDAGVGMGPVPVWEMVDREMLGPGAASACSPGGIPLGWLAGVRGALAN